MDSSANGFTNRNRTDSDTTNRQGLSMPYMQESIRSPMQRRSLPSYHQTSPSVSGLSLQEQQSPLRYSINDSISSTPYSPARDSPPGVGGNWTSSFMTSPMTSQTSLHKDGSHGAAVDPPIYEKRKQIDAVKLEILNGVFERTRFPSVQERNSLAKQLDMTYRSIAIWFLDKRQANRQNHTAPLPPPSPPTTSMLRRSVHEEDEDAQTFVFDSTSESCHIGSDRSRASELLGLATPSHIPAPPLLINESVFANRDLRSESKHTKEEPPLFITACQSDLFPPTRSYSKLTESFSSSSLCQSTMSSPIPIENSRRRSSLKQSFGSGSYHGDNGDSDAESDTSVLVSASSSSRLLPRNKWRDSVDNFFHSHGSSPLGEDLIPRRELATENEIFQYYTSHNCYRGDAIELFAEIQEESSPMIPKLVDLICSVDIEAPDVIASTSKSPRYSDKELKNILDMAQLIADKSDVISKRDLTAFLYRVAKTRSLVPPSLYIAGAKKLDEWAVGSGGFADIYKGTYQGEVVALKVIRRYGGERTLEKEITKESILWRQLYHRNVLPFFGLCVNLFGQQIALVSPWVPLGDLRKFLRGKGTSIDRTDISFQIASGLEYLHLQSPAIIHGDLRPANIIVDEFKRPRITDFGLSRAVDPYLSFTKTSLPGTCPFKWLAPELLNTDRFGEENARTTKESDIYAFGMTMFEIFADESPFHNVKDATVAIKVGERDERPSRPGEVATQRGLDDAIWGLIEHCWEVHSYNRPDISSVASILKPKVAVQQGLWTDEEKQRLQHLTEEFSLQSDHVDWDSVVDAFGVTRDREQILRAATAMGLKATSATLPQSILENAKTLPTVSSQFSSEGLLNHEAALKRHGVRSRMIERNLKKYVKGNYHPIQIGDELSKGRYIVARRLGCGHFSTICFARDTIRHGHVAIKILKSTKHCTNIGKDEVNMLHRLNEADPVHPGRRFIVSLVHNFEHQGPSGTHLCMVFDVLKMNLLHLIRSYNKQGPPILLLKQMARQLLSALEYIHDKCRMIHTDLKPETIMFSILDPPNSSTTPDTVTMLENVRFIIVDFMNATWANKKSTVEVQTRQYRSPEVILGSSWGAAIDIWSLACIIFEVLVGGEYLFDPRNGRHDHEQWRKEDDHLAQIIELLGDLPRELSQNAPRSGDFFDESGKLRRISRLNMWPFKAVLEEKYLFSHDQAAEIALFLLPMLHLDPRRRASASASRQHAWLQDVHLSPNQPSTAAVRLERSPFLETPTSWYEQSRPGSSLFFE